jgi:hypothetical protein
MLGVVTLAVIIAVVTRPRAVAWDTKSVSVVWSGAEEGIIPEGNRDGSDGTSERAHPGFKHDGFKLEYALQNNTDHDITIPQSVTIMKQLTKGGVLEPSRLEKLVADVFLPARQRSKLTVETEWGCGDWDVKNPSTLLKAETLEDCYARALADSDALVLFDHSNHLEITLPKPILRK